MFWLQSRYICKSLYHPHSLTWSRPKECAAFLLFNIFDNVRPVLTSQMVKLHLHMKRLLCFFLLLPLISIAQEATQDNFSQRVLEISPFVNLKVYSGIEIELIASSNDSLVIRSETPEEVVSVLKGNTLKLRMGLEYMLQKTQTQIQVYHSQPLDLIDLSQGSRLIAPNTVEQTSISLIIQEGSKAELKMKVEKLSAKIQSGSKFFPTGTAKNAIISVSSGATCEADQLFCEQVDVKANFGSVAYVNASQLVDAKSSVNATIRVHGNPAKLITKESVGGKVIEMQ